MNKQIKTHLMKGSEKAEFKLGNDLTNEYKEQNPKIGNSVCCQINKNMHDGKD
jgi:hypothetical protein